MGLLWPDWPEPSASTNLRNALSNLRKAIGDREAASPVLLVDRETIQFNPAGDAWVDVHAFRALTARTAARRTPGRRDRALPRPVPGRLQPEGQRGLRGVGAAATREQLERRCLAALARLAEQHEAAGDLAKACEVAWRAVDLAPWQEEGHRRLMRLLAFSGQRSAALTQYETCRHVLERELGVEPAAETMALYERIRSGELGIRIEPARLSSTPSIAPLLEPHLEKQGIATPTPIIQLHHDQLLRQETAAAAPARQHFLTTTDYALVGRHAEQQKLVAIWRGLTGPHFVWIEGEAGIGKTRLAEDLLMLAEREAQPVARTRSHALAGGLAYGPIADWLRTEALRAGLAELDAVWLTEVARLLPELLGERPGLPPPGPITDGWQHKRFFEALARAFTVKRGRLLLVLDDLQWCDADTLDWLHYLLDVADRPLLVVGTVRSEEADDGHALQPPAARSGAPEQAHGNPPESLDGR